LFILMRELSEKPLVCILIEDETALLKIQDKFVYEIAFSQAAESEFKPDIKVFVPKRIYNSNRSVFNRDYQFIVANSFREYLVDDFPLEQIFIIHNASRPLVPKKIYDQGIKMLLEGCDAVKQQHVVVDTLKAVDQDQMVLGTINRDEIQALTTPEFYWVESILSISEEFAWFYELKPGSKKDYIMGELESTRIRSEKDLLLVNALIQQGRLI
jgi:2-C-methyl-D-erythritol 4-phosphate cytidylyltransferase